jgi:hypothetical protein
VSGTVTTTLAAKLIGAFAIPSRDKGAYVEILGRLLAETGLDELLEAGQAMRDCNYINTTNSLRWDAALAKFQEALK